MERLRNRVRENPNVKLRDLQRALPKRAKGYWLGLHRVLYESSPELNAKITANMQFNGFARPTRPTDPTADNMEKAVKALLQKNSGLTPSK